MTVVSHAYKFIFICPRKTAGTSIQVAFSRCAGANDIVGFDGSVKAFDRRVDEDDFDAVRALRDATKRYGQHSLPDAVREEVGERVWNEYFKFTVARNPWDLLVSYLYSKFGPSYWHDIWWTGRPPLEFLRNLPRAFLLHWLRAAFRRGCRKETVETILRECLFDDVEQIPRFYFSRGAPYADRVIRFENLQQDYNAVCGELGLPLRSLPRTNTKPRSKEGAHYRDYYTDFSREYMAALCRPMTDAFGYRF